MIRLPDEPEALACLYGRYSERPTEEDIKSLAFQEDRCRAYCSFAGLTVAELVQDPDTSARRTPLAKREGGARLLELVGPRKIKHVVAYKLDRLFRSVEDGLPTVKSWTKRGVVLHLVTEGGCSLNTSTAWGQFMVVQRLAIAELEAGMTAERTSDAMRSHQKAGRKMSSIPPYGVRFVDGDSKRAVEVPEEQRIIAQIQTWKELGWDAGKIASKLNALEVPSRGNPHLGTKGRWTGRLVTRILERASR